MSTEWAMKAIPLTDVDRDIGIADVRAFTSGTFAIVALEDVSGLKSSGHYVTNTADAALRGARAAAHANLIRLRDSMWYRKQEGPTHFEAGNGVQVVHLFYRRGHVLAVAESTDGSMGIGMRPIAERHDPVATRSARQEAVRTMLYNRSRTSAPAATAQ